MSSPKTGIWISWRIFEH